jgi:G3E family GTPase
MLKDYIIMNHLNTVDIIEMDHFDNIDSANMEIMRLLAGLICCRASTQTSRLHRFSFNIPFLSLGPT